MAVRDFLMPDLGEGLTEGEIVRWLVAAGDTVAVDQPVVEVTTEKAVVEVPTPFAGRVVTLHGADGDMIAVGSPLISIEVADVAGTAEPAGDGASGNVLVGYGTNEEPARRRHRVTATTGGAAAPAVPTATPPASPVVRRRAAELGIDLSAVGGTGPGGIVTVADLDRAAAEVHATPAAATTAAPGTTRVRLTGVDRVAAERLTRSHGEIPTATALITADATALLAARSRLDTAADAHVTPFSLLLRLCVVALQRFPRLNAHFDTAANELVTFEPVHLGVAVQTERGLVVPVVRDAQRMTATQLAAELERVAKAARAGGLGTADLSGSTFTVSNFGAFGVDGGTALINPPEVAILGVGRIAERPWVVEGRIEPRSTMQLSLVFDHRAADGAVGGGFLKHLADLIEQPGDALT